MQLLIKFLFILIQDIILQKEIVLGFENEKTVTYVRDKIRELVDTMISTKDHIDWIFYLIKSAGDRIFYDKEKELIKQLIQFEEIDVIFCSNTFGMEEE